MSYNPTLCEALGELMSRQSTAEDAKTIRFAIDAIAGDDDDEPRVEARPKHEPCTHRSGCGRVDECMAEQRCLGREEGNTDPTEYDTKGLLDALLSVYARSCTYQTRHLHDRWVGLRREVERRLGSLDRVSVPREVVDFFEFCNTCFVPFTGQQEQLMIALRKARVAMGRPEYRTGERPPIEPSPEARHPERCFNDQPGAIRRTNT